jgi:predicted alpha-1,6-mannanase (GH76 family)
MNAYKRTNDLQYKQLIADIYDGCGAQYANYDWTNQDKWFIWDDMMWWVIALARGYQTTGDNRYLENAKAGFHFIWYGDASLNRVGSYDASTGGMEWAWKQRGKTACINYPTVVGAMTLYNITKDEDYVTKAKGVYAWARANLFDPTTGKVADNKVDNNPADWTVHDYNQASCIGAAVMLFKKTGDSAYLKDALAAADYTKNRMSDANGILPFEGGEEQGVYNAILAQYMIRLIEDCNRPEYLDWLRKNINTAYGKRNLTTGLMGKDYKTTPPSGTPVSVYDACSIPALMQVIPPSN